MFFELESVGRKKSRLNSSLPAGAGRKTLVQLIAIEIRNKYIMNTCQTGQFYRYAKLLCTFTN
jgi:cytidylate kinase